MIRIAELFIMLMLCLPAIVNSQEFFLYYGENGDLITREEFKSRLNYRWNLDVIASAVDI